MTQPTCGIEAEFDVFIAELDLANIDETTFKEIPNNGVATRTACIAICGSDLDCVEACNCKWDCQEGTPGLNTLPVGVTDIVYDRCLEKPEFDQVFCKNDCEQRCRGTYNGYILTIDDDADRYFAGNDTQACAFLGDGPSCTSATNYWTGQGTGLGVECVTDPVTNTIDCFCKTEAPSASPSAAPSESPSESPSEFPSESPSEGDCTDICSNCSPNADGVVENGVYCCNNPKSKGICKGGGTIDANDLCCNGNQACKGLTIVKPMEVSTLTRVQCSENQACKQTDFAGIGHGAGSNVCCMDSSSCDLATGFDDRRDYY